MHLKLPEFCRAVILSALTAVAVLTSVLPARASILISPQRVVLSDDHPHAVINLHNPDTAPVTYNLRWAERRMLEDGQLIILKDGDNPRSISSLVRFSPRRVVVAPGQTQTVRLDFRPPADLGLGEYRSSLHIGGEPAPRGSGGASSTGSENEGISFQLIPVLSYSVPVFVRHGKGAATNEIIAIAPGSFRQDGKDEPGLKVTITRAGEFASYGRLAVYQQLTANGPVDLIGESGGVAIYTEISRLTRVIPLKPGSQLQPGSYIRVTYEGEEEERGTVFAERSFRVGQ